MPEAKSFLDKVWDRHEIERLDDGRSLVFIDRLLLHELSTPRAFEQLEKQGVPVAFPEQVIGFSDHIVTTDPGRTTGHVPGGPEMLDTFRKNTQRHGIRHFDTDDGDQGIVHVVAPELGFILPGMTVVCGDSHTCTSGGVGALGWGIGTSEIAQVLATQTLAVNKPKTMRIDLIGEVPEYISAKDIVLSLISEFGVSAGTGHMIEFGGEATKSLSIEARMTLCNMAIEFGARIGVVEPDTETISYLKGRRFAPSDSDISAATNDWLSLQSDAGCTYDAHLNLDVSQLSPKITWGTTPADAIEVAKAIPQDADPRALEYMGLLSGQRLEGLPINQVFIGSCTNGRLSDLREAAAIVRGKQVSDNVRAMIVPGSQAVKRAAEAEGIAGIFKDAGFEWRESGCSMCPGLNGDKAEVGQRIISTTNRNFENRQGTGARTHLASPATAAAAAIAGIIVDPRDTENPV